MERSPLWHRLAPARPACPMFVALLFAFALALPPLSAVQAAAVDEPSPSELSSFDGRWRQIDENESDADRLKAIEGAITGLSWLMRQMASGVLRSTTAPPPEMEFIWDGGQLYQAMQGEDRGTARPIQLDGELRDGLDRRGEPLSWAWSWGDEGLRVRWQQHQAYGSNLYRLDGDALVVEHTIHVTALSNVEPIVYRSRYRPRDAAGMPDVASQRAQD